MEAEGRAGTIPDLLGRYGAGDEAAGAALFGIVETELRAVAHRLMRGERGGHTLQTTALVNEAWARLVGGAPPPVDDQRHFVRLAARTMRRVLVDHARRRRADKRRADDAVFALRDEVWAGDPVEILALDEALERLAERDAEVLRVVELRFFAGLTHAEVGVVLGRTERQVRLAWTFARGWLKRELEKGARRG